MSKTNTSNDNHQRVAESKLPDAIEDRLASTSPESAEPDPFDNLDDLRLSQDFGSVVGAKRVITTVPCRKPNRHEFVRVRPGDEWRLETEIFEDKVNRESYMVAKLLWDELLGEVTPTCLFQTITRQGDVFLWPCKLPSNDKRGSTWNESALAAARLAETRWVRVAANMGAGSYDNFMAIGDIPNPEWPEESLKELLRLCFKTRYIDSSDHEVLLALRGAR